MNDTLDIWALLEQDAPNGCAGVQDLYSWSLNYDAGRGPFVLFLDLIGYSEDEYGEKMFSGLQMGYLELSKLATALEEYASRPYDVLGYVRTLMTAEANR